MWSSVGLNFARDCFALGSLDLDGNILMPESRRARGAAGRTVNLALRKQPPPRPSLAAAKCRWANADKNAREHCLSRCRTTAACVMRKQAPLRRRVSSAFIPL